MIHSYKELLEQTLVRYENAPGLSRQNSMCLYGDKGNGIGCGIGCHLPPALGNLLDDLDTSNIGNILRELPMETAMINCYIDTDAIGINLLIEMQVAHDTASSLQEYVKWMKKELIYVEWQEKKIQEAKQTMDRVYA